MAYAIAHVGGVLVEETLLPLVSRVDLWTSGRLNGSYPGDGVLGSDRESREQLCEQYSPKIRDHRFAFQRLDETRNARSPHDFPHTSQMARG